MRTIGFSQISPSFYAKYSCEELPVVREIFDAVKAEGDKAVRHYNEKFDKASPENLEVSKAEIAEAYGSVDAGTLDAIKKAKENIEKFALLQLAASKDFETQNDGVTLGQRTIPLESVGCYVPGGRYPLPSTALMTVVPAKVAGVKNIVVCSPKIAAATIVAADLAGATRIFSIGGIQAIAAMAFGTQSVPAVDKIVGPGNKYVAAAKKQAFGAVGIDFIAGPSEVMVIADDSADAALVAADLLAQAEHDPLARSDLVTDSAEFAKKVEEQVEKQLGALLTKEVASQSIANGTIVLVDSLSDAIVVANKLAPEHLELQVTDANAMLPSLKNYGSLFVGKYCAEVFGDYSSGTNHSLPTSGAARYTGGLSVREFVKVVTYQRADKKPSAEMINAAVALAKTEGLAGHENAARLRLNSQ